jgi:hypothetical protein
MFRKLFTLLLLLPFQFLFSQQSQLTNLPKGFTPEEVGKRLAYHIVDNRHDLYAGRYKKRWSVEECHKSIKQNAPIGSSPARSVKAQSNHLFASIFAFVKLEKSKLSKNLNHFAIKAKLYMAAVKVACFELKALKENLTAA